MKPPQAGLLMILIASFRSRCVHSSGGLAPNGGTRSVWQSARERQVPDAVGAGANALMHFLQCERVWSNDGGGQRDESGRFGGNCPGGPHQLLPKCSAALAFAMPFQTFGAGMTATHDVLFRFGPFAAQHPSVVTIRLIDSGQTIREALVNLALRLNVLAVCAVFAFVGAVLLGAF